MPKVKAVKGIRYPKKKAERDAISAGEATAADVADWVRVKGGKSGTVPDDMIPEFNRRGAIEKED